MPRSHLLRFLLSATLSSLIAPLGLSSPASPASLTVSASSGASLSSTPPPQAIFASANLDAPLLSAAPSSLYESTLSQKHVSVRLSRESSPSHLRLVPTSPGTLNLYFSPSLTVVHALRYITRSNPASASRSCAHSPCLLRGLRPGVSYAFSLAPVTTHGILAFSAFSNYARVASLPAPTISFSANGATGSMPKELISRFAATYISPIGFTDPGYSFAGWATTSSGQGTTYEDQGVFLGHSSTTLYAQWIPASTSSSSSPSTYTVFLNSNGGSTTDNLLTYQPPGLGLTLPEPVSITGSAFVGWYTSPTDLNSAVSSPFTPSSPVVLYALWSNGSFSGSTSSNWSGYEMVNSTKYTSVSATWVVPTLDCVTTPSSYLADWVGLGGGGVVGSKYLATGDLLQTGSLSACPSSPGSPPTSALWWELAPEVGVQLFSIPVSPGDVISASVSLQPNGTYQTSVTDLTAGATGVSTVGSTYYTISSPGAPPQVEGNSNSLSFSGATSAEWVAEAPTSSSSSSSSSSTITTLSSFSPTTFYNLAVSNTPIDPGTLPLNDQIKLTPTSGGGASPGPVTLTSNGPAFTITYTP